MHNQEDKNWNNFFLGLLVVILPWLSLPEKLQAGMISFLALLIVIFSLARVGGRSRLTSSPSSFNPSISAATDNHGQATNQAQI